MTHPPAAPLLSDRDELLPAPHITPALRAVASQFAVKITPAMMTLIDPSDPTDPIAKQFMPSVEELSVGDAELKDPIGDHAFSPLKGVVHRYPDRVLLKLLLSCPVACRYCFRREQLNEPQGTLVGDDLSGALSYIRERKDIWEVILSGGDPLLLSSRHLGSVVAQLNAISHVKVIRFHTRIPVVDPHRVTPQLIEALRGRAPVYIFLHCNHPRELTPDALAAVSQFVDHGIPVMSQSVLLRGVNDDHETLKDLMRAFVEARVKPHYLHHPDLARGTGHFRVSLAEGQALMKGLRGHLSGLCQPTYMLDIPGGYGKIPVGPSFAEHANEGWSLTDTHGDVHSYPDR